MLKIPNRKKMSDAELVATLLAVLIGLFILCNPQNNYENARWVASKAPELVEMLEKVMRK